MGLLFVSRYVHKQASCRALVKMGPSLNVRARSEGGRARVCLKMDTAVLKKQVIFATALV